MKTKLFVLGLLLSGVSVMSLASEAPLVSIESHDSFFKQY